MKKIYQDQIASKKRKRANLNNQALLMKKKMEKLKFRFNETVAQIKLLDQEIESLESLVNLEDDRLGKPRTKDSTSSSQEEAQVIISASIDS